jgi:predicted ATPase
MARSVLIGRAGELSIIKGWIDELATGAGRVTLVEGEPGIGKSALLSAAVAVAEDAGYQAYTAYCDELSQEFPLRPLLDAVTDRANAEDLAIAELVRSGSPTDGPADVLGPAIERLVSVISEWSDAAPTLLVVDDLQWADFATVVALARFVRLARSHKLLILGAARPVPHRADLAALRRDLGADAQLTLVPLAEENATRLVAQAVGGTPGPRLARLVTGSAGNPLYLTELADALIRGQLLTNASDYVDVTSDEVPASLSGIGAKPKPWCIALRRSLARRARHIDEQSPYTARASASATRAG